MKIQTSASKIPCKICGQLFHSINNTHLASSHNLDVKTYLQVYGGPIKSEEYKRIAYRNHSLMMRLLRKSGVVTPPPLSEAVRHRISERMKLNNPMKDEAVAKHVGQMLKGKPSYKRTYQNRLKQRNSKLGLNNPNYKGGVSREYVLWKKDRQEALTQQGEYCFICGMTMSEHKQKYGKGLPVHHIDKTLPLDNSVENTMVLCVRCHLLIHGKHAKD